MIPTPIPKFFGIALTSLMLLGSKEATGVTYKPVIITPDASIPYYVSVEAPGGGPLEGANVRIEFLPELCDLLILCERPFNACPYSVEATTGSDGRAEFVLKGGGCWDETVCALYLARIYVSSVLVAKVGVRSSDVIGSDELKACDMWCASPGVLPSGATPGSSVVALGDAVWFTTPLKTGTYVPCADIDGDLRVGLSDAILITPGIGISASCVETTE